MLKKHFVGGNDVYNGFQFGDRNRCDEIFIQVT